MRDLLLLSIILSGAAYALRKPWVGVILWTWVSLMNPHAQFGYSMASFPVAMIVGLTTLVGMLLTRDRQNPFVTPPVWALLLFIAWISITLPFSFYLDDSVPLYTRSLKIFLMIFVTIALINTKDKLNYFVGVATFSIAFYGFKGGLFTLATGGNYRVWGPGGFIEGNNEVALALVMTIPLIRYLQLQATKRWIRYGLGVWMALTAVTVLGTYSRGALLALGAMTMMLWLKGEKKALWAILLVGAVFVMLPFMPDAWWDRMDTIKAYQEDGSALGRINAWYMAWNLALKNFFGGGFSIYNPMTFLLYAPDPTDVHAAHSIFFQVLGEHGFVGLALFMAIWLLTWSTARRAASQCSAEPELKWIADLSYMVQVSLVGYFIGGAFLSLAYFDLPFDMMAMVVIASRLAKAHAAAKPVAGKGSGSGSASALARAPGTDFVPRIPAR